jgi:hypothetical protein
LIAWNSSQMTLWRAETSLSNKFERVFSNEIPA